MRGGKRAGAGRKKGSESAGTKQTKATTLAALAQGITPLDYMLSILRDSAQPNDARFEAAKAAAPYCHAKLANVELTGKNGGPMQVSIEGIGARIL